MSTTRYEHHIGGAPVAPATGEYFESTNPATTDVNYEEIGRAHV